MGSIRLKMAILLLVGVAFAASNRITLSSGKEIFVSGMNLAWINFAADVGDTQLDTNTFKIAVQELRDSGANTIRVWLSTNGSNDPKFSATDSLVTGLGSKTISNVKQMLEIVRRNGMTLMPVLLTHNYMEPGQYKVNIGYNRKMLTTDAGIQAYINNAVVPLVTAIGLDSALICWEIFNEPEGMVNGVGWTTQRIEKTDVQKVVNRVTGAIHRAVPGVKVSNGAVTLASSTDVSPYSNWYSDANLVAAGGDADGTLDFYMVHYYPWNGAALSPFRKPASYWNLDKPLLVGEFPAASWGFNTVTTKNIFDEEKIDTLFSNLYNNGYAGALSWSYFGDGTDTWLGSFATNATPMSNLFKAHTADIKIMDVVREVKTGNGVLKMSYVNDDANVWSNLKKDSAFVLTGKSTISVDVLIPKSSQGSFKLHWVVKTGDAWRWDVSDNYCSITADSTWQTCTANLAEMHYWEDQNALAPLGQVKSIILHFSTENSFTGEVWFDNVKIDGNTLYNFDNGKPIFSVDAYNATEASKVVGLDVAYVGGASAIRKAFKAENANTLIQKSAHRWFVQFSSLEERVLRILDINGSVLWSQRVSGTYVQIPNLGSKAQVLEVQAIRSGKRTYSAF